MSLSLDVRERPIMLVDIGVLRSNPDAQTFRLYQEVNSLRLYEPCGSDRHPLRRRGRLHVHRLNP